MLQRHTVLVFVDVNQSLKKNLSRTQSFIVVFLAKEFIYDHAYRSLLLANFICIFDGPDGLSPEDLIIAKQPVYGRPQSNYFTIFLE